MTTRLGAVRRLSVIVPMRNERDHIDGFVASLSAQDFDGAVEVLVADGSSTDGSVALLEQRALEAGLDLRVMPNPGGAVSRGLNRCIEQATGDLIVRMDCHSTYPPDYLRQCAAAATETGAANVGGVVEPRGRTAMERAVAAAMDCAFGGIGWTRHATSDGPVDVDTVTFGAFRPDAFRLAGTFDEDLIRNQDDELNLRLRRAGGRVVLDPRIRVAYVPRGSLRAVFSQYHGYGFWKVAVMLKHRQVLSARSLAPIALVISAGALATLAPLSRRARGLLAAEMGAYATMAGAFAVTATARRNERRLLLRTTAVFPAFHLGYGVGMLRGCVHALARRAR